jgi:MFS family permease
VPFLPGLALALLGLLFSVFFVRETRTFSMIEAQLEGAEDKENPSFAQILLLTSWKNKTLFSASQAGMVNNLNDGMVWGLLPLFLSGFGLSVQSIGLLAATYPGVWGVAQLFTGALSDRVGRKGLIVGGMWVQAVGIGLLAVGRSFSFWFGGVVLLGLGTAMVYPTLLAAISDVAHPTWRGSAVGVYRLWRDSGYAVGALASGILADALGMEAAIAAIGVLTLLSGIVVATTMRETLPQRTQDETATPIPAETTSVGEAVSK